MHDQQLKNAVMRAARGGTELRRGGIVMVRLANGACGLCRAAELSDYNERVSIFNAQKKFSLDLKKGVKKVQRIINDSYEEWKNNEF